MLDAFVSDQGVCEVMIPSLNRKELGYAVYFFYSGIVHPQDLGKVTMEILVKVFGFPEWFINFEPEKSDPSNATKGTSEFVLCNIPSKSIYCICVI